MARRAQLARSRRAMAATVGYNPVELLDRMKTAIAVPDAVFNRGRGTCQGALGMSRSEFYSTAARRYLAELDRTDLRARASTRRSNGARTTQKRRALPSWAGGASEQLTADDEW